MKILIAGDWHSEIHETQVASALEILGHDVVGFGWAPYFASPCTGVMRTMRHAIRRLQNKFITGPGIVRLNKDFMQLAKSTSPDLVFLYRPTHILPETLSSLRRQCRKTILAAYNNDDAFSPHYPAWMWRHFVGGLPFFDIVFAYRKENLDDFIRAGARRTRLLRSFFVPSRVYPLALSTDDRTIYDTDVVFIGHYENDGRLQMLERLAQSGVRVRIFGPASRLPRYDWNTALKSSAALRSLVPAHPVWGDAYNKALNGARIALCFLSKMNRDSYTRRCFEIPAAGTLLLSEYSADQAALFREGVEADFFRDSDELVAKTHRYLANEALRKQIAAAGTRRVHADGHDVVSRTREMLDAVGELS